MQIIFHVVSEKIVPNVCLFKHWNQIIIKNLILHIYGKIPELFYFLLLDKMCDEYKISHSFTLITALRMCIVVKKNNMKVQKKIVYLKLSLSFIIFSFLDKNHFKKCVKGEIVVIFTCCIHVRNFRFDMFSSLI